MWLQEEESSVQKDVSVQIVPTHCQTHNSEDTLMELSLEENFTENREQFLDDEVDEIMDYVFGVWSWFVY